jgi:hypothetical protein
MSLKLFHLSQAFDKVFHFGVEFFGCSKNAFSVPGPVLFDLRAGEAVVMIVFLIRVLYEVLLP